MAVEGEAARDGTGAPELCDTHMHVYRAGEHDPPATLEGYAALRDELGVTHTVYVQPSLHGRDHRCLLDALERDPREARAVGILGTETSPAELSRFHAAGMRGVRFHDLIPGCLAMAELEPVARHVAPLGWHVLVQVGGDSLPRFERRLLDLPCDVVIDHMGLIPGGRGVDDPAFRSLLRLLDSGRCWVKLSAPYEVAADGAPIHGDARVEAMLSANPEGLIWGSNWPHPRFARERKPDDATMLDMIRAWCGREAWPAVAAGNAARLYGFDLRAG